MRKSTGIRRLVIIVALVVLAAAVRIGLYVLKSNDHKSTGISPAAAQQLSHSFAQQQLQDCLQRAAGGPTLIEACRLQYPGVTPGSYGTGPASTGGPTATQPPPTPTTDTSVDQAISSVNKVTKYNHCVAQAIAQNRPENCGPSPTP
jgi:hypothetical protein